MVDVSTKDETDREAVAAGRATMLPETLRLIMDRKMSKGDVFGVARVAGIMAAKRPTASSPCATASIRRPWKFHSNPTRERPLWK